MGETRLYGDYTQVLDVHVEPKGRDATGELKHACLHLRGPLAKTRRVPVRQPRCSQYFGVFYPDLEPSAVSDDDFYFCLPLREEPFSRNDPSILGLVLALVKDGGEEYRSCCNLCSKKLLFTRVGTFESDKGDPLRFLAMPRPKDWCDWGGPKDHLWFPEDAPVLDFAII